MDGFRGLLFHGKGFLSKALVILKEPIVFLRIHSDSGMRACGRWQFAVYNSEMFQNALDIICHNRAQSLSFGENHSHDTASKAKNNFQLIQIRQTVHMGQKDKDIIKK